MCIRYVQHIYCKLFMFMFMFIISMCICVCVFVCIYVCLYRLRLLFKLYKPDFYFGHHWLLSYSTAAPEVGAGSMSWGPGKERKGM